MPQKKHTAIFDCLLTGTVKLAESPVSPGESPSGETAKESGEFLIVTGRALSAVIVKAGIEDNGDYIWDALDFSRPGVLAASTPLFIGQTVYTDHRATVRNWCGVIIKAIYNESSTPPGIDVEIKIDAVANPEIARGIMMTPPAITSMSGTVQYEYEHSHPDIPEDLYWRLRGTMQDGEMVRNIITNIVKVRELSFVPSGADPNAKIYSYTKMQAIEPEEEGKLNEKTKDAQTATTSDAPVQAAYLADVGKHYVDSLKAEVAKLAEVLPDDKELILMTTARMLATGKAEDLKATEKYMAKLREKADSAMPLTCAKCGCTHIERRSSRPISNSGAQPFDPSTVGAK